MANYTTPSNSVGEEDSITMSIRGRNVRPGESVRVDFSDLRNLHFNSASLEAKHLESAVSEVKYEGQVSSVLTVRVRRGTSKYIFSYK